jgi:hypothetical protein
VEKPLLIADVNGDEIIVRTLGFFAYAKPSNAPQLILKRRTATVTTRSWLWPGKQRTTRRASSGGLYERSHLVSTGSPTGSFGGRASASLEQLGGANRDREETTDADDSTRDRIGCSRRRLRPGPWAMERKRRNVVCLHMDILHKLDEPDQWWFAPLIWAGAYMTIAVLILAYFLDAF